MPRYLCKFHKGYGVKFISHLDLVRCIQRAIRRAQISVSYSKGFNPHAELSLVTPLPVGTWSVGEYMEIYLDKEMDESSILERINPMLPSEIIFTAARCIDSKLPAVMGMVDGAEYEITVVNVDESPAIEAIVTGFLERQSIEVVKWSKKGEKQINIRPMIRDLKSLSIDKDIIVLSTTVDAGSRSNLNPELIVDGMKQYITQMKNVSIRDIKKKETFINRDGRFMVPMDLVHSVSE